VCILCCALEACDLSQHRCHKQEEREAAHQQAIRAAVATALAEAVANAAQPAAPIADQVAVAPPQPDAQPGSQETIATEPQSLPGAPAVPPVHVKVRKALHRAMARILNPQIHHHQQSVAVVGASPRHDRMAPCHDIATRQHKLTLRIIAVPLATPESWSVPLLCRRCQPRGIRSLRL